MPGGSQVLDDADLTEGTRVGRFLVLRDIDGNLYGVAASAVSVIRMTDDGTLMMLPGGKMLHTSRSMGTLLAWLDGRS